WSIRPSALEAVARDIAGKLGVKLAAASSETPTQGHHESNWVDPLARDLLANKGSSIVIAGNEAPPVVHALAHAMNDALGNVNKTVFYTEPLEVNSVSQRDSLYDLVQDIDAGRVEMLVIVGGNPAYN